MSFDMRKAFKLSEPCLIELVGPETAASRAANLPKMKGYEMGNDPRAGGQGNPGQGNPGQGNPGKSNPGQANPNPDKTR